MGSVKFYSMRIFIYRLIFFWSRERISGTTKERFNGESSWVIKCNVENGSQHAALFSISLLFVFRWFY